MTTLLLIRHGENDYVKKGRLAGRLPEIHLNEKGRNQAQAIAERLAGSKIRAVYSSPLERAKETADPIAQVLNLPVIERRGLMEVDFGDWQDQSLKSLRRQKLWKSVVFAPSRTTFPNGESFAQAQHRMQQELDQIVLEHAEKDWVVCVSHGDMIKLAVAYYIGLPLDMFQRLQIAPASITALTINELGGHLLTMNYDISFTFPKD
jgi:probable phosphoglycerate mutase